MSTTFYNTFSITISYSKNFGAFSATKSIPKGDFGLPKFWRILKHMYIERTECVPKDDFGFPKFWRTLKQMDMERTECVPKDDFGPA